MQRLTEQKLKILAEKYGWSLARAEGYVDGETSRRSGATPSSYALVGFDDYCVGFRAGFFVRTGNHSTYTTADAQLVHGQPRQGAT